MATKKNQTHALVVGDSHLVGYHGKDGNITDWHGKNTGWRIENDEHIFTNEFGEKSYKMILVKHLKSGERYAVAYSLGEGMLVRGESSKDWTERRLEKGEFDRDDLWQAAQEVSEYWAEADREDAERDQAEQEAEFEEEHSG